MAESDDEKFARFSKELLDAIDSRIEPWVIRTVTERLNQAGIVPDVSLNQAVERAAAACRSEVFDGLDVLLSADLDDQRSTPLAVIRSAVHHGSDVLDAAGVAPVDRDEFERRSFPDDIYGLSPASISDVDDSLVEPALVWGAAKAHIHRSRHN